MKTQDLLNEITRRNGLTDTHYGLWKHMKKYGWSESSCRNYRKGTTLPDDRQALDIAHELGMKPEAVIAIIHAERSTDAEVRAVWERMARRVAAVAGAAVLSVFMTAYPADSSASEPTKEKPHSPSVYYVKLLALLLRRLAAALALALAGALASPAHADPLWDSQGITEAGRWELVYQAVAAVDWMQTRYIAQHPDQFYEVNPILGRNPSLGEVDRWFLAAGLAHAAISHYLPARYARPWQLGSIGFELALVWRNDRVGVGLSVPL